MTVIPDKIEQIQGKFFISARPLEFNNSSLVYCSKIVKINQTRWERITLNPLIVINYTSLAETSREDSLVYNVVIVDTDDTDDTDLII